MHVPDDLKRAYIDIFDTITIARDHLQWVHGNPRTETPVLSQEQLGYLQSNDVLILTCGLH